MILRETHRRIGLWASGLLLLLGLAGLTRVHKDADILSLLAPDHPERQRYEEWRAAFQQTDALVALIADRNGASVLSAPTLAVVDAATKTLAALPGVDAERISSLTHQTRPVFEDGALRVEALAPIDAPDPAAVAAVSLRAAPVFDGLLVSQDRSATLILAPLLPGVGGSQAYPAARKALDALELPAELELQLAGDAAVTGFLSAYIERDALVLTPIAVVLSLLILAAWLRHPAALLPGGTVLLGTLAITIGAMGWAGCSIYVITSSLPAILVCVSIADCVHLSHGIRRQQAEGHIGDAVGAGLREQFRPMLLTTLTTVAGFIGIAVGSSNAPMREFGLFAALGTAVAFLLTVAVVPTLMRRFPATIGRPRLATPAGSWADRLWARVAKAPQRAGILVLVLAGAAIGGLPLLEFNEERIRNFSEDSAIRIADTRLNHGFAGSRELDLVLIADQPGDLLQPAVIEKVRALQQALRSEGLMQGTHSYVDLLDTMRVAAAEGGPAAAIASRDEAEQWLFMYELQGERRSVDDRISVERDRAYIRGYRGSDDYLALRPVAERIRQLAAEQLAGTAVRAELTGSAYLIVPLFEPVVPSMMLGAGLALVLVALCAAVVLRNLAQGLLCAVPVSMSVLAVLGVMGWTGIWLDVATAMMASLTIGLGIDFAIYAQNAALQGRRDGLFGTTLAAHIYQRVAAPLGANAVILAVGFSVTALSSIPPVRNFGLLVTASVLAAAACSLLMLPALHALATRRGPVPGAARHRAAPGEAG